MLLKRLFTDEMADAAFARDCLRSEIRSYVLWELHGGLEHVLARACARLCARRFIEHRQPRLKIEAAYVIEIADDLFMTLRGELEHALEGGIATMRSASLRALEDGADPGQAAGHAAQSVAGRHLPAWALDEAMISAIAIYNRDRRPRRRFA